MGDIAFKMACVSGGNVSMMLREGPAFGTFLAI